jgi:uncharacterized protein YfdQ (DUF2303 family)
MATSLSATNPASTPGSAAQAPHRTLLDAAAQHLPTTTQVADINPGEPGMHNVRVFAVPAGHRLEALRLEDAAPFPARTKTTRRVHTLEALLAYMARHAGAETQVWANADVQAGTLAVEAVIDDHAPTLPSWCEHRVHFAPEPSVEWQRWKKASGQEMTQLQFALFIEENLADIHPADGMPTGGDMLKMALQFEAVQDMRLKSHVRLQNGGVKMEFIADDDAATAQRMEVFNAFTVALPVFRAGAVFSITAKFRYRNHASGPKFWFELQRADKVAEQAVNDLLGNLRAGIDAATPVFLGTAKA